MSIGSFNTHGPDTKLSLSGAVQKHCFCGLSAQITLFISPILINGEIETDGEGTAAF